MYTNQWFNRNKKGIIECSYNSEFRRQHQLTLSVLKELGFGKSVMEQRIQTEVSRFIQMSADMRAKTFSPADPLVASVLSVIVSIVFGRRMDDEGIQELIDLVHRLTRDTIDIFVIDFFPSLRFLPKFRSAIVQSVEWQDKLFDIIREQMAAADDDSFVKYYTNREGSDLDTEQLEYIVRDLLLAGTETSSSTLLWALCILAGSDGQRIQDHIYTEINSHIPHSRLPSLSDRAQLHYTEATILELLRFKPVAPLGLMHLTVSDTTVEGYFIPSKSMIIPNIYSVHMDPDVWYDPDQFRPERFLDEYGQVTGRDRIMPFSIGRRSCLGELLAQQEIYLFLAGIIQNFVIKPPAGQTELDVNEVISVTIAPGPFEVQLIPRNSADA